MKIYLLLIFLSSLYASGQRNVNPTDTLTISGKIKNERVFTLLEIETLPKKIIGDVKLTNQKGETKGTIKNLTGVSLRSLFEKIEFQTEKPKELNGFYFIFVASDNYKVVFSWNEIFNTETGNNLYIVTEMDGKNTRETNDRILFMSTKDMSTGRRYIKGLEKIIVESVD